MVEPGLATMTTKMGLPPPKPRARETAMTMAKATTKPTTKATATGTAKRLQEQAAPPTSSATLKFKRKTTKAITTDFQTKACGPFATSPIPNRNSNQPIGMPIAASINTLPKPCLRKQRANGPSCSSRTTTSACLQDYSNKSSRTS